MENADVLLSRDGGLGRIVLNRPKAINALTHDMARRIRAALTGWEADDTVTAVVLTGAGERGLCAGGDIRAIHRDIRSGGTASPAFWRDEYALNAHIARYPKPYVAIMDGIVMGGGVGLSAHGGVRVVTERSRVGMPAILDKSPTALKVTLRSLRRARHLSLEDVLAQEFRVSGACLREPDLFEGIRAQVVDKDRNPRWRPETLDEVTDAKVDGFFADHR